MFEALVGGEGGALERLAGWARSGASPEAADRLARGLITSDIDERVCSAAVDVLLDSGVVDFGTVFEGLASALECAATVGRARTVRVMIGYGCDPAPDGRPPALYFAVMNDHVAAAGELAPHTPHAASPPCVSKAQSRGMMGALLKAGLPAPAPRGVTNREARGVATLWAAGEHPHQRRAAQLARDALLASRPDFPAALAAFCAEFVGAMSQAELAGGAAPAPARDARPSKRRRRRR